MPTPSKKKASTKKLSRRTAREVIDPAPIRELRALRRKMVKDAGGTIEGYIAYVQRATAHLKTGKPATAKRRRAA